ncbi:MAG: hypothetical protein COU90_02805 [Candidatus Ryanbacteria bacterium CG10_big_fil_rev_8_21_14_0_10_43_42]|uniref:Uncharacterized protein n=1 Tax=Candidatus Ryanbacteria bacterium CG10_big_fil_rev_8_21_14_0_10_43_42 TaxID=1974864 RepID=A0A2M8KWT0_9BACT|nr:MAG: hypothetical protein COU90_02805 [Candidatus Ryanbacteria bacterium CG10_big_fil_rev_8_21_14_0_10_43_42]
MPKNRKDEDSHLVHGGDPFVITPVMGDTYDRAEIEENPHLEDNLRRLEKERKKLRREASSHGK